MRPKRIVKVVLAVTLLTMALACCFAGMAMFGIFDDYQMKRAINPPNSAVFLFETDDYPMTNLEQKTLYYASSDDIDTIKAIYEKSGITFIGGNLENDWWVVT